MIIFIAIVTGALVTGSIYYFQNGEATAAIQASKVLIISNNDTYYTVSGGTSAAEMSAALTNYGFNVTTWVETANGNAPPSVAYANQFDVVIFTQGVGYRNTSNNKPGLSTNDLAFLKEYLNIGYSGNKARLIIEGEDVMSDILRVGTSTDQRDILKINTSSSDDNYRRMDRLRIDDSSHPVWNHVYDITGTIEATTAYQTEYQDYIAPNLTVGAKTVGKARFTDGKYFTTLNTWADSSGHREVFMPFAWYVNSANGITNTYKDWREKLLVNMVSWVGEREINVTASSIANNTASRGETEGMLSVQLSPNLIDTSYTPPAIKGIKINFLGTLDPSHVTAYVYSDAGTIGTLDGGDTELGSASFAGGVATVNFNLEVSSTKHLIVAYKYSTSATFEATAGARLANTGAVMVHDWDKLSRVYGSFPCDSSLSTIKEGGTADIKTPAEGTTVRSDVTISGTTSTEYCLCYSEGYNNKTGPWTEFAHGASGVNNSILGVWNTAAVTDGSYTVKLHVYSGTDDFVSLYVDNTAPVITEGPVHSNVLDNQAAVAWKTDESSTTEVMYRVFGSPDWDTAADSAKVLNHSYTLTGLSANSQYDYKVRSVDAAGNSVESGVQSFTTLEQGPYAEITYPAVVGEVIPRVGGTVEIKGSAFTSNEGHSVNWAVYYGYGESREKVTAWNLIHSSSTPVTDGALASWETPAPDGAYVLKLWVSDPDLTGPTSYKEDYVQVIVDNTVPEIYGIGVQNVTNVSACVYWQTSKNTTDQVVYGCAPGVYPFVLDDTEKDKKMFLYDLEQNKTYYYKIKATDGSGHTAESPEQSFTTDNNTSDSTPPDISAVVLTAAGRTDTTVDLKWDAATDDTGVAGYKLYSSTDGENYTFRGAVPGFKLYFTDTGLSSETTYWYYLRAFDVAGNLSAPTSAIKAYTTKDAEHINPHGAYSKLTVMCSKCHTTHRGKKEFLFNRTQEATMCYTCHDAAGSGSKYSIEAEYDPDHQSRHPLPMNHTSKECASCHNPHLNPATYPRLLSVKNTVTGEVYHGENGFCYACHGSDGPDRVLDNTAGAHDVFENSIHNLSQYFPNPESGSGVRCVPCHYNHASYDVRLTKAPEEENCYHCHGATSYLYGGIPDIEADLNRVSYHNVKGSPETGNVECVNCHNPHFVNGGDHNTSDPYNTVINWTGDRTSFCLRCHDGDDPPQKHVTREVNVPYTVYFPAISLTTTDPAFGWDKTPYLTSGHYSASPTKVQCNDCHSPHGSPAKRLLARREDQFGDNYQGECGNCHGPAGTGRHDQYPDAKDIYSTMTYGTASLHPTFTTDSLNIHDDNEDLKNVARHAECWDCHESHTVTGTAASSPDIPVIGDQVHLLGRISGVWVSNWPSSWDSYNTASSDIFSLVFLNPADGQTNNDYQWQLCLKCHSKYAYTPQGSGADYRAPHYNPSDNGTAFYQTDVAREFNPNTGAGHRVAGNKTMPTFTYNSTTYYYGKFVNGWQGNTKMKCTDCHQKGSGVMGPHGSTEKFLLRAYWDPITTGSGQGSDTGDLCFLCHDYEFYTGYRPGSGWVELSNSNTVRTQFAQSSTGKNLHTVGDHKSNKRKDGVNNNLVGCGTCHGGLPHGWKYLDTSGSSVNNGVSLWTTGEPVPYKDGVEGFNSDIPNRNPVSWVKHQSGSCYKWCDK